MSAATEGRALRWARRCVGAIGIAGLTVLGFAWWLTYEPAPRVRVLWRPDVTPARQAALEQKYLLVNGRDRLPEGSIAYDLLDTSRPNIQALVTDAAAADTNDIERNTFEVPFDVEYGGEWMWIAHRTPGLRDGWMRGALILALTAMAVSGLLRGRPAAWLAAARRRYGHRKQGYASGPNVPLG